MTLEGLKKEYERVRRVADQMAIDCHHQWEGETKKKPVEPDTELEMASVLCFVMAVFVGASKEQHGAACGLYLAKRGKLLYEGQIRDIETGKDEHYATTRATFEEEFKNFNLNEFQVFTLSQDF